MAETRKRRRDRIADAIALATKYANVTINHNRAWVIDQMVRELAGDDYDNVVRVAKAQADEPGAFVWYVGIAP